VVQWRENPKDSTGFGPEHQVIFRDRASDQMGEIPFLSGLSLSYDPLEFQLEELSDDLAYDDNTYIKMSC